jgi:hypothetical protein
MIDTEQRMIDIKMKLMDSMVVAGRSGEQLRMSVLIMMDKIDKWNNELGLLRKEKRVSNSIVEGVIEHAARSMGMVASTPDDGWLCEACTFVNTDPKWSTKCKFCMTDRPKQHRAIVAAPAMMASTKPTGNLNNDDNYSVASVLEGKEGDGGKEGFKGDEGDK